MSYVSKPCLFFFKLMYGIVHHNYIFHAFIYLFCSAIDQTYGLTQTIKLIYNLQTSLDHLQSFKERQVYTKCTVEGIVINGNVNYIKVEFSHALLRMVLTKCLEDGILSNKILMLILQINSLNFYLHKGNTVFYGSIELSLSTKHIIDFK